MVYWTILFYQVYRNHAKSNGIKPLFFFEAKGLLSQPLNCFWIVEQDAVVEWALLR